MPHLLPLKRSSSQDSLISISGMDIHLVKGNPSKHHFMPFHPHAHLLHGPSPNRTVTASQPLAAHLADVTASSSKQSIGEGTNNEAPQFQSLALLSGLAATPVKSIGASTSSPSPAALARLGGWVRSRWGVAPIKSPTLATPSAYTPAPMPSPTALARTPGINQKGIIPGLRAPLAAPVRVDASVLDEEGLRESLAELGGGESH